MAMGKIFKTIAINPGSTSTKLAYFENTQCISEQVLRHTQEEIDRYTDIIEQYAFRKEAIMAYLAQQKIEIESLDAVIARGGILKPLHGGAYIVSEEMVSDLKAAKYGQHASNLGAIIANEIAAQISKPAYIVDPVVVDEMHDMARFSGIPDISRISAFHALNQKAVARKIAHSLDKPYEQVNLIIAHLGGGISVAAHQAAKVIDVNNALEEGPFSPERTGGVPAMQLIEICYSGKYTKQEIKKKLVGKGGLNAYLGTGDVREIARNIDKGDAYAKKVLQAMAYQIAKEIGSCSAVLYGQVDAICLTGGIAYSRRIVKWIEDRVSFIAPVKVYPGEDEMMAMVFGVYKVLTGKERAYTYES